MVQGITLDSSFITRNSMDMWLGTEISTDTITQAITTCIMQDTGTTDAVCKNIRKEKTTK